MERRLLVLVSAAGLLAGCASGGSLAKAHGPVFALNNGRWQPTEADYRIGPHPKLPIVPAVSVTKTEKAPKRRLATAHVGPVHPSPQNLTAILANGEPGALAEGGHRHMKAVYVPPLPALASVKALSLIHI